MRPARVSPTLGSLRRYLPWFVVLLLGVGAEGRGREGEEVPACYEHVVLDAEGNLVVVDGERRFALRDETPHYTLRQVRGLPTGTATGFAFRFRDPAHPNVRKGLEGGTLFYGLVDPGERHPMAKWKRRAPIDASGRAHAKLIPHLQGKFDFVDWTRKGRGALGYRVADATGAILHEGRFFFTGKGPFEVDEGSIVEGPFLNVLREDSVVVSFESLAPARGVVEVPGVGTFADGGGTRRHEIRVRGLAPDTVYAYTVSAGGAEEATYALRTAPRPGTRSRFCFAFTSDSRGGIPSGERNVAGVNAYMMRKIMALATSKEARFLQFTGDTITGYRNNVATQRVEYGSWKRSILPFASRMPVVVGMGNHEALLHAFDDGAQRTLRCDRFPFGTASAEALFAEAFVHPTNGPESEDGAACDPGPDTTDFPPYGENVFAYVYDNVAIVVLNSNYWYSPSVQVGHGNVGGNPHGYLMDNQLAWLEATLDAFEEDEAIDHVFCTHHTPAWPNGGHVDSDMWYRGRNEIRPCVAGTPVATGIIECRDAFWKILLDHPKVLATLTGDEHNYALLEVKEGMPVYDPGAYLPEHPLRITRTIWQINNGAAGAPYYGLERTPWNADVSKATPVAGEYLRAFTTENAVVFIHVDGGDVEIEVVSPDTLAPIDYPRRIRAKTSECNAR